jgi:outer membrane protein assembly factor BamB
VQITGGSPPTLSVAWCAGTGTVGSPIETTTDGTNNPIVWVIGATGDQKLHGFDADTGAVLFDGGSAADAMNSTSEFITPIVAKGRMFVAADNRLYAFTTQ